MRISTPGKQVFPEKSGFCGKSSTPAHVRFFPKPFISFASAQLRLRWHRPCARRLQQEVADRKPSGCERPRGHNPRAVVTGFKIYMRCARRTVPLSPKLALAELKQFIQVSLTLQVSDRSHGTRL